MKTVKIKKLEFKKLYDVACEGWKTKFDEKFKNFIFDNEIEFESSFLEEMQKACTKEQLPIFLKIFGKFVEQSEDLFKIKSYSEVCKKLKEKEFTLKDFSFMNIELRKKALAQAKIQQIEKLFNGGWVKNWLDRNQQKWFPYFNVTENGLVFHCSSFHCGYADGQVAFFKDEKTSNFIGKTFPDIYKDII